MRQEQLFELTGEQHQLFADKALQWAMQEETHIAYYSSCGIAYPYGAFPQLLAIGALELLNLEDAPFDTLLNLHTQIPDWRFGYFSYELKNGIHGLQSKNASLLNPLPCQFFRPKHLIFFEEHSLRIQSTYSPKQLYDAVWATALAPLHPCKPANLRVDMSKVEYLEKVMAIKAHILEGDCYELNLCMGCSAENYVEDPLMLYRQLAATSPSPFSCFQRFGDHFLISASPERFLRKEGKWLLSQPIKGTMSRGTTPEEDLQLKLQLANSEKDKAENLMIVDLVRNDLARSCRWGSVQVPELFGIYSFRQVHQMISTITGALRPEVPFTEAIKAAFPMGSMTGAPKKIVMELIDHYENSQRNLYSGAAGFISPADDFDFNVIIRSMLYHTQKKLLTFSVGGAITWDSDPEQEYQECLLKARAILQVLQARIPQE